jgi:SPP1 family predicted phage head-tail adaptor
MEAGKLRNQVQLQRVAIAVDSHGDQTKTWTTLATVQASIEPLSGREFLSTAQTMSDVSVRIKVRGRPDIRLTPKDRVRFDDPNHGERLFDIRHVVDMAGKGLEWQLMCTERF